MATVTAALAADPYALDLRLALLGLLLEEDRMDDAKKEAQHIHALAPTAVVAAKVVVRQPNDALPAQPNGVTVPP